MSRKTWNTTSYIRYLAEAAVTAALYSVLTILIPGSSGQVQVRLSEALTVLPFFTPAAIPGLFAGCLISNMVTTSAGIYDVIFGSLATLTAAFLTSRMPSKYLAPLPPVVINAVVVATVLNVTIKAPLLITMGFVGLGEMIACYGLGYPLILFLEKRAGKIFDR
ncbi:MAG TPA: QueT transporter family protein [Clostridiales bacterium]|nr:QueT transporter family protein [Clostridiales bacterium]HPV02906.1 QueT transporter family protein [Clostridiales bacterium]